MMIIQNYVSNEKATMYFKGGLGGVVKKEIRLNDVMNSPYAQYAQALKVFYKDKGGKKLRGTVFADYRPYCVIVRGWNQPDLKPTMETTSDDGDTVVKESRHSLFSANYLYEADQVIDAIDTNKIIADYRYTKD